MTNTQPDTQGIDDLVHKVTKIIKQYSSRYVSYLHSSAQEPEAEAHAQRIIKLFHTHETSQLTTRAYDEGFKAGFLKATNMQHVPPVIPDQALTTALDRIKELEEYHQASEALDRIHYLTEHGEHVELGAYVDASNRKQLARAALSPVTSDSAGE